MLSCLSNNNINNNNNTWNEIIYNPEFLKSKIIINNNKLLFKKFCNDKVARKKIDKLLVQLEELNYINSNNDNSCKSNNNNNNISSFWISNLLSNFSEV